MIISVMAGIFSLMMLVSMIVAIGLACFYFGRMHRKAAQAEREKLAEPVLKLANAAPPQLDSAIAALAELQQHRREDRELASAITALRKSRISILEQNLEEVETVPSSIEASRPEPAL